MGEKIKIDNSATENYTFCQKAISSLFDQYRSRACIPTHSNSKKSAKKLREMQHETNFHPARKYSRIFNMKIDHNFYRVKMGLMNCSGLTVNMQKLKVETLNPNRMFADAHHFSVFLTHMILVFPIRHRNKYVSTVIEQKKSKKSTTPIHCKSRSTQSRVNINERRARSDSCCPLNDCAMSNSSYGTIFRKNYSTLNVKARHRSVKHQTVRQKRIQNEMKEHISDYYHTLQDRNKFSSCGDCILKVLTRSNKNKKQDYLRNVQRHNFQNLCPCLISKLAKMRQYAYEKDYLINQFSQCDLKTIKRIDIGLKKPKMTNKYAQTDNSIKLKKIIDLNKLVVLGYQATSRD